MAVPSRAQRALKAPKPFLVRSTTRPLPSLETRPTWGVNSRVKANWTRNHLPSGLQR